MFFVGCFIILLYLIVMCFCKWCVVFFSVLIYSHVFVVVSVVLAFVCDGVLCVRFWRPSFLGGVGWIILVCYVNVFLFKYYAFCCRVVGFYVFLSFVCIFVVVLCFWVCQQMICFFTLMAFNVLMLYFCFPWNVYLCFISVSMV